MAMEIFRLVGSIFVDNEKANKSLSQTDDKAGGVGKTFLNGIKTAGKWAIGITTAAATAATAIGAVSAKALESYADYEQLVGGIETLFKDSADIVLEHSKEAYRTAGMSANEYLENVTSFSASLLQSVGGDTQKAAEIADMAMVDISDNANKMGSDLGSIQQAYQGFAKGQYQLLDNLKLGYGGTKTEMERLLSDATKFSGVKYDIDNLNDVYSAIHVIQGELGITGTTAAEATTTIAGSINMIKKKFEDFKVTLGSSIAPTVQSFLSLAIDNLPVIENMIVQIAPVIANLMATLLPPLMQLVSGLLPPLVDLFNAITPILATILSKMLPVIIQLLQKILPPVVQIVQKLLPPLLNLLIPILDLLSPLINLLDPILDLVVALLNPLASLINNSLTPLISVVVRVIEIALKPLKAALTVVSSVISGVVIEALALASNRINEFRNVLSNILGFIKNTFTGNWKAAWNNVKNIFSTIASSLGTTFKSPINVIIGAINGFIRGLNKIKVPDWVPGLGGKGFHISEIPKLARGGVLEKGQTAYLEGEGAEAIVPLEKNKKWIAAVANDMDNVTGARSKALVDLLSRILAQLKDTDDDMQNKFAQALDRMRFDINGREFARLVKANG